MKFALLITALLGAQGIKVTKDEEEKDCSDKYFLPNHDGMIGAGGYERQVPFRFASDDDDIFMRSMIENYALEQKTKDCKPSGKFWMNEATTMAAASEVLETHKGLKGDDLKLYLETYFKKAWGHFDVNRTGYVEVIKMPQFMRFLASDQYFSLQP